MQPLVKTLGERPRCQAEPEDRFEIDDKGKDLGKATAGEYWNLTAIRETEGCLEILGNLPGSGMMSVAKSWLERVEEELPVAAVFSSLSGILCVGHNMRSVDAPETEIVHV